MKKILIQLDTDSHASTFDRVVAVDAEVDELFSYGAVLPGNADSLVHGGMFTRGPKDLKSTAVFVGGSDVAVAEKLFEHVSKLFFGPIRLSVMMDANGCNTTAAAAVLSASKHLEFEGIHAFVAGGTGPVGLRVAQLLAARGVHVNLGSRSLDRAKSAVQSILEKLPEAKITPCEAESEVGKRIALKNVSLVVACGAFGVQLLSESDLKLSDQLKVAIDLNAVPPAGIEGIEAGDAAVEREGIVTYGAIGVGGLKMKIHKAAIKRLFESNDQSLDTEAIYSIGEELTNA